VDILHVLFQIVIFLGIINVWLIRCSKSTSYRGKDSLSLKEEFHSYGYSTLFFYFIGLLKFLFSLLIFIGIWIPSIVVWGSLGMVVLMIGALLSHVKVLDPFKKSIPALIMLAMASFLFLFNLNTII
tara:strand:+ start:101 stop:481 length:381 start_codon:yes stop_codon:yes gene_type:complete